MSTVSPPYLVYAATKGAIEQLVRVLAKDLGARGVTVNAVSPGATDTDFFRGDGKSEAFVRHIAGLFNSFQSSASILDPQSNPNLFQSTLVIIIKAGAILHTAPSL